MEGSEGVSRSRDGRREENWNPPPAVCLRVPS